MGRQGEEVPPPGTALTPAQPIIPKMEHSGKGLYVGGFILTWRNGA